MVRTLVASVAVVCLSGCAKQIEVCSDTSWTGLVNQATVSGEGNVVYELWDHSPGFTFSKSTVEGTLSVRFRKGRGDEPVTTAPYGTIWGSAW